jgi:hypothetical protein
LIALVVVKNFLWLVFNNSIGRVLRFSQRSLTSSGSTKSVITIVTENAIKRSANFAEQNFKSAVIFEDRKDLWKYCLETSRLISGAETTLILEFGVWKGESINFFADALPSSKVYGFDSFQGLEENWYGYSLVKNAFNLDGKFPAVRNNVELIPGWYDDTLSKFMVKYEGTSVGLLHLDSDTYTPTKFVLKTLHRSISKGTIIIFDEFFGYPNWELHEYLAWVEFVEENKINFRYLGYTNMQVAVEIL